MKWCGNGAGTFSKLQRFRRAQSIRTRSNQGREGGATLLNLNPAINTWYLLEVDWADYNGRR